MKIVTDTTAMQNLASKIKSEGKTIGFVPTMGFLHEGHLELVKEARKNNDQVIMSIFVNPLQFGPNEDFDAYPRNRERDERLAEQAGVDILFLPTSEQMYPHPMSIQLKASRRTDVLCGKSRPGHFDGVITVLAKLFHMTLPNHAYFGLKDAQQVAVVDGLIQDLNFPVNLVGIDTVREDDGLAKSSRNVYLSSEERKQAPRIYQSLLAAKKRIAGGEISVNKIKAALIADLEEIRDAEIDYASILSYPTLAEIDQCKGKCIIAVAVKFANARLIDNIIFEMNGQGVR